MFNQIPVGKHERKVAFHAEAPFAKHDYRYRQRADVRMAGTVWSESPQERGQRLSREYLRKKMRSVPVGLGFGENDKFGPDNSYDTRQPIKYTHAREY
jgi:hypothetical protein